VFSLWSDTFFVGEIKEYRRGLQRAPPVSFRVAFITAPWHSLAADWRDKLNLPNLQPGWWASRDRGEVLGAVDHYAWTYGTSGNADISETKFVNAPCDGAFLPLPVPLLW